MTASSLCAYSCLMAKSSQCSQIMCDVAEVLKGSTLHHKSIGSCLQGLDPISIACLASSSTSLLPSTSSWFGTHTKFTLHHLLSLHSLQPWLLSSSLVLPCPILYPSTVWPQFLACLAWKSSSALCTLSSRWWPGLDLWFLSPCSMAWLSTLIVTTQKSHSTCTKKLFCDAVQNQYNTSPPQIWWTSWTACHAPH